MKFGPKWGIPIVVLFGIPTACSDDITGPEVQGQEVWVTAQDASQLKIIHGTDPVETVALPTGAGPHEVDFSPNGEFAYVANVGNGDLIVVRATDREIVATLDLAAGGTHQAKPSPDGSVILVSQIPTKMLIKVAANEAMESWQVTGSLVLPNSPVCASFSDDGRKAYASLAPSGIAVVDVMSMSLLEILPTAGGVQCGLVNSEDRPNIIYVDSNGPEQNTGHFYLLDTRNEELTLFTQFAAQDLHGFGVGPDERRAFAAERGGDALQVINLTAPGSTPGIISLDATTDPDKPDKVAVGGDNVYVTLRTAGKLAVVNADQGKVDYLDLVAPSANALHGVAVRP